VLALANQQSYIVFIGKEPDMRRIFLLPLFLVTLAAFASTQQMLAGTPAQAKQVLDSALKDASSSKKNVFIVFHATWCSWCKRLDAALTDPEVKKIIKDNYIVTHLDVMERGEKAQTVENPGGQAIMKDLGGEKSGLPFYAILDAAGKKMADSNVMPGNQNIGFPGSQEEIAAFENILKQTAPRMSAEQRAVVTKHLGVKQPG
jgi:thioredoxin-related protein